MSLISQETALLVMALPQIWREGSQGYWLRQVSRYEAPQLRAVSSSFKRELHDQGRKKITDSTRVPMSDGPPGIALRICTSRGLEISDSSKFASAGNCVSGGSHTWLQAFSTSPFGTNRLKIMKLKPRYRHLYILPRS
ncbi:hypothetical protein E2P81_ATG07709 [Venturia nashicola]|nr:hypothetical protein E2P81_ATG07709 [Venturia nashicola]